MIKVLLNLPSMSSGEQIGMQVAVDKGHCWPFPPSPQPHSPNPPPLIRVGSSKVVLFFRVNTRRVKWWQRLLINLCTAIKFHLKVCERHFYAKKCSQFISGRQEAKIRFKGPAPTGFFFSLSLFHLFLKYAQNFTLVNLEFFFSEMLKSNNGWPTTYKL